ncbi:MAG: molybdopterin-dependent oxidoreductase [Clostridiales Family XIII bacterium]|jgi:aldehyde oxidoreductase|nr:molybdopterin-dependent oxidoreductase [Clostridiales Family XIII bacterium]
MITCKKLTLHINGADRTVIVNPARDTLADVLRRIGLTGVKIGCGVGVCGACSVILNGKVTRSCVRKISSVEEYSEVVTVEGIGNPMNMHPIQAAWVASGAVQCGFCVPGFVVSTYQLLKENPAPTRDEVREWFVKHRNVCRCTGYKQITDAVMTAAAVMRGEKTIDEIQYAAKKDESSYGKAVARPSGPAKACGVADYGDDIELKMPAGTLHVVPVQPRVASHAKILNIDYSEAEKMPGVFKVITAKDVKGSNMMDVFVGSPRSTGVNARRHILSVDKIVMYGDVVAMVAAESKEAARDAAAKVKVEIEQLPEYTDYLDAVVPGAIRIHESTPNIYSYWPLFKGGDIEDIQADIDNAEYVVEGGFYSTREPHMSIEGDPVEAYFDEEGVLNVHCKTQAAYWNKGDIAQAAGVDPDKCRVIMNPTGASFGWSCTASSFSMAAIAAVVTERPVALSMTWEEFLHYSGKRAASYSNGRLACDKDGRIVAAEMDFGIDHGAYTELGADLINRMIRFAYYPYVVPKALGLTRAGITNHGFGTAYRGYGAPQAYTMSESLIDMMAEKLGIDKFEIRRRNIAKPGDINLNGHPFEQPPCEQIMDTMEPIYKKALADTKARNDASDGKVRYGVGLAWGGYNCSDVPYDAATVALELLPDGKIAKYDTWQDLGQGGDIGSLMVTLEALQPLGLTEDDVRVIQSDTSVCPDSGLSAGSRSHLMNGLATRKAGEALLEAMKKPDGTYRTYEEMVADGKQLKHFGTQDNSEFGLNPLDPNTGQGNPAASYNYALYCCEVAVDTETGKTNVLKFTCVYDVGVIGNIQAVEGQAYGGLAHCIGFALQEDYRDVKVHNNMMKCGIAYATDIPDDLNLIALENPRPHGPWGSTGASEVFQTSAHVAVLNAIAEATGVRIYELPATPDKVKAGLETVAAGGKTEPKKYFLGSDLVEELEKIKANPVSY